MSSKIEIDSYYFFKQFLSACYSKDLNSLSSRSLNQNIITFSSSEMILIVRRRHSLVNVKL